MSTKKRYYPQLEDNLNNQQQSPTAAPVPTVPTVPTVHRYPTENDPENFQANQFTPTTPAPTTTATTTSTLVEEPSSVASTQQCPPTFMRMTINAVPDSSNLLSKCNIPFGCVVHPMAESSKKEVPRIITFPHHIVLHKISLIVMFIHLSRFLCIYVILGWNSSG